MADNKGRFVIKDGPLAYGLYRLSVPGLYLLVEQLLEAISTKICKLQNLATVVALSLFVYY